MFDVHLPKLLAFVGWEDTQNLGFFNRLLTVADLELLVDTFQVSFDGFS